MIRALTSMACLALTLGCVDSSERSSQSTTPPGGGTGGSGPNTVVPQPPSDPEAGCEAIGLLQYLYDISGEHVLSGQESMLWDSRAETWQPSRRDAHVHDVTGTYPAVFSSDFGDFDTASLSSRGHVADVALAYAQAGSIIQLHYHMVQPDLPDGSGFDAMHDFSAANPYPAAKIDAMLTPGDPLNVEHLARLDEIADYLGTLRDHGVAVLWRPYHEMNGSWFWWGGQARYADLWVQMWERFTLTHGLHNLLWVFSVNYWSADSEFAQPSRYYPGHDYVDVLGVDVYVQSGHQFERRIHDALLALGGGKPVAITENGVMPDLPVVREDQPYWVYWTTWFGFETADRGNPDSWYDRVYGDPSVLTRDDVAVPTCSGSAAGAAGATGAAGAAGAGTGTSLGGGGSGSG